MNKPLILFLLLGTLLSRAMAVEIAKSPNDDRQYQYLLLDNGLRVVLVSDPEADKAAAALTVGVGSTSNPPGREGLAHFLEHMLFMGTKKYPEVDGYSEFIKKNGGQDNAFTAGTQTTYFFDIKPPALEEALDRFAQFFIAPLMDARYVEREKHAVESEYQLKLKEDDRRIAAAQKQGYNPRSPWSRFAVGNLETLADRPGHPVRQDLLDFYRRHYSANIMGLAVVGPQPLPVLARWVKEKFSAVPNHGAERWKPTPNELIYLPDQLPEEVDAVPLKKLHKLEMVFLLPPMRKHWREAPLDYIIHFLGDEGPGSLHSVLRRRGWLTALTASSDHPDDGESYLDVEMELTPEGMQHRDEILGAFFAYVDKLRSQGIERWRYDELARKQRIDFRFKEKGAAADYAVELSGRLLEYPPAELLTAGNLMERYDPALIRRALEKVRPENLSLTLVDRGLKTDKVERYYKVRYAVKPVQQPAGRRDVALISALALPKPNPFLPEHLALKPIKERRSLPAVVDWGAGERLWVQQDDSFGVPRAAFAAGIELPRARDDVEHAVMLSLLVELIGDQLNEYAYPAKVAGLDYLLAEGERGLVLMVYGYDDKQARFLDQLLEVLANPRLEPDRFAVYKKKLARELANKAYDRPYRQVLDALHRTLVSPTWSPKEKLAALEKVDLEKLRAWSRHLWDVAELHLLGYGNLTPDEARRMEADLKRKLLARSRIQPVPDPRLRQLPAGQTQRVKYPVDHPDAVVAVYYQGESGLPQEAAYWQLLGQVVANDFYSELRTHQQLGYVVAAVPYEQEHVPGLLFLVQSTAAPAGRVEQAIERFIDEAARRIATMSDAELAAHKAGLVAKLRKKDRNTMERALRYLDNLARDWTTFDYRRRVADAVERIDRDDLAAFWRRHLLAQPRRLVVWSPGTRFGEADGER